MSAQSSQSQSSHVTRISGSHLIVNERLLKLAERELKSALVEQERPIAGMYVQRTRSGDAAFERAVSAVCAEAHRLDLRAEELLVALKQAWSQLATTRARHLGDRDGDVLREVVTSSIKQFFAPIDARRANQAGGTNAANRSAGAAENSH